MTMVSHLLVPVDFSEGSRVAAEYAIFLAKKFKATVEILHVWEAPYYFDTQMMLHAPGQEVQTIEEYIQVQATTDLNDFLTELSVPGEVEVKNRFVQGAVESKIVEIAAAEKIDLIIMGTHGRTGISRLLMGSVAEQILREAPCPVLTISPNFKEEAER